MGAWRALDQVVKTRPTPRNTKLKWRFNLPSEL
ncbi:hypothetical protein COLO4_26845 [Corchorus olitorius]|uniref:Uncharacterized protein n=1 Tax=Corchorus olitorius TaxID=93759 RepID=A0A1R3HU18_9ROSI|nr:hypothetical protein COLO4_26845 [Corchorus olitorius]